MYQYRPDEIAEHTDSLAYYRIFNIWLAQFKKKYIFSSQIAILVQKCG